MEQLPRLLEEGDIIVLREGMRVYADVPKHFVYANKVGCWDITHHDVTIGGAFAFLAGTYLVEKTQLHGGGTGHGPHDIYPNGHHVYCVNTETGIKVDFYQTGCFTAMVRNIVPVNKAEKVWKMP